MTKSKNSPESSAGSGRVGDQFVRALARGLDIIQVFDHEHPALSLSQVASRANMSRATARRFLHTLVQTGYAEFDGKLFRLRPKILQLGYSYLSSLGLPQVARPFMETLVAQVHESCSASVLDGYDVVYVARVPIARRIMSIDLGIGARLPAHATSMGRVLLAALPVAERTRYLTAAPLQRFTERTITDPDELSAVLDTAARQGWVLVDQELERGLRSVAVPIHGRDGRVMAALNVGTHASRFTLAAMRSEILPPLRACAENISAALPTHG